MDNKSLVEIIIKDAQEIQELAKEFRNRDKIQGVYLELALSKVKNLYLEVQMLNSSNDDLSFLKKQDSQQPNVKEGKTVEQMMQKKLPVEKHTEQPVTKSEAKPAAKKVIHQEKNVPTAKKIESPKSKPETQPEPKQERIKKQPQIQPVQNSTILADKFKDDTKSLNETLSKQVKKKSLASQFEYKAISDIRKAVNINSKIMFIKELFGGNANQYNQAVDQLNNFTNLDEAMEYIATNMEYDSENKVFIDFLEVVYRRYPQ